MNIKSLIRQKYFIVFMISLLALFIVSQIKTIYVIRVINLALIYSINTFSLMMMLGMGGQLIFSSVAFMGLGAYVTANLCSGRLGFETGGLTAILASVVIGGLAAFLFGLPLLRLSGTFFTFATIAIVQIFYTFFLNYVPAFGGPAGISGIKPLSIMGNQIKEPFHWFIILLIVVLIVMALLSRLRNSQFGRRLSAIRDNEIAAQTLGVNVYWTRVKAYTISGMLAGLSGAFLALFSRYISADNFTFIRAATFIIMAMLGGVNYAGGILIGSALITFLPEVLRGMDRYLMFIYGVMVIILMIFMPMGLVGLVRNIWKKMSRKRADAQTNTPGGETL